MRLVAYVINTLLWYLVITGFGVLGLVVLAGVLIVVIPTIPVLLILLVGFLGLILAGLVLYPLFGWRDFTSEKFWEEEQPVQWKGYEGFNDWIK